MKQLMMALYDLAEPELTRSAVEHFVLSKIHDKCKMFYTMLDKFSEELITISNSACSIYVVRDFMKRKGYDFWLTTGCPVPDKDWKIGTTLESFGFYKDTNNCYETMAEKTKRYALFYNLEIPKALKSTDETEEDL